MKALKIALSVLTAIVLVGCSDLIKGKPAADTAIANFHELYNQGKLEEIWNQADARFHTASTKEKYDAFLGAMQRKLGKVVSTTNTGWNVNTYNLETTVRLSQNTVFEHGQGTESFAFVMNGTNAVLFAYNIQSMDLITK